MECDTACSAGLELALRVRNDPCKFFCHTRAQLTIPDPLIIIPDDQLGPQVALYSTYPGRMAAGIVRKKDLTLIS